MFGLADLLSLGNMCLTIKNNVKFQIISTLNSVVKHLKKPTIDSCMNYISFYGICLWYDFGFIWYAPWFQPYHFVSRVSIYLRSPVRSRRRPTTVTISCTKTRPVSGWVSGLVLESPESSGHSRSPDHSGDSNTRVGGSLRRL